MPFESTYRVAVNPTASFPPPLVAERVRLVRFTAEVPVLNNCTCISETFEAPGNCVVFEGPLGPLTTFTVDLVAVLVGELVAVMVTVFVAVEVAEVTVLAVPVIGAPENTTWLPAVPVASLFEAIPTWKLLEAVFEKL